MRHVKLAVTVVLGIVLATLTACQSAPQRTVETADGKQVAQYSGPEYAEDYAVQGGLIGAAGGAAIGCLIGEMISDGDCAKYALIFGGVGAAGGAAYGYDLGRETEVMASRQISAEESLASANSELEKARAAERAATNVVRDQKVKLETLRTQSNSSSAAKAEYEDAIEAAKGFQLYLGGSIERVSDSIEDIQQRIAMTAQTDPQEAAELGKKQKELEQVRDNLRNQLNTLIATIETHEVSLTS